MHAPRSAGASVRVALEHAFSPGAVSPRRHDASMFGCGFADFDALDVDVRAALAVRDEEIAELSGCALVSGHFSLPTLLRITGADAIATVLREPRARLLSLYAFWRLLTQSARDAWRPYRALDHASRPLDEFLTEPQIAAATDNQVCRMLLGEDARIPSTGWIAGSDIDSVARDATIRLETLGYVGILELGDSMWDELSSFFDAPLAPTREATTETRRGCAAAPPAHGIVTLGTLDALDARTSADVVVYRHVLSARGYSDGYIESLRATAFAAQLVRIGSLICPVAADSRMEIEELRQELARAQEQVRWQRLALDTIEESASWRYTAPLRDGKQRLMRLASAAGRTRYDMRAEGAELTQRRERPERPESTTTARGRARRS